MLARDRLGRGSVALVLLCGTACAITPLRVPLAGREPVWIATEQTPFANSQLTLAQRSPDEPREDLPAATTASAAAILPSPPPEPVAPTLYAPAARGRTIALWPTLVASVAACTFGVTKGIAFASQSSRDGAIDRLTAELSAAGYDRARSDVLAGEDQRQTAETIAAASLVGLGVAVIWGVIEYATQE